MRIESKLCHVSENKTIVQVTGLVNDKVIGTALAEGATVELAEDNAISRLNTRLNQIKNDESSIKPENEINIKKSQINELDNIKNKEEIIINKEPSDWSNELTAIDLELDRLNWSRDDEMNFLKQKFGYNNRNKITKYDDIIKYLNFLKTIDFESSNNKKMAIIKSLIEESDNLLIDLSWDHKQGREYLQREFNVSTRTDLDENQLISFVSKLKTIRNEYLKK